MIPLFLQAPIFNRENENSVLCVACVACVGMFGCLSSTMVQAPSPGEVPAPYSESTCSFAVQQSISIILYRLTLKKKKIPVPKVSGRLGAVVTRGKQNHETLYAHSLRWHLSALIHLPMNTQISYFFSFYICVIMCLLILFNQFCMKAQFERILINDIKPKNVTLAPDLETLKQL